MWKGIITIRALLLALALVLVVNVAHADPNDVLHACARKDTGALRLANTCRRTEAPVQWGQQGPPGPQGPAGTTKLPEGTITGAYRQFGSFQANFYDIPYIFSCKPGEVVLSAMAYFLENGREDGADYFPAVASIWGNEIQIDWRQYVDKAADNDQASVAFDMWCATLT